MKPIMLANGVFVVTASPNRFMEYQYVRTDAISNSAFRENANDASAPQAILAQTNPMLRARRLILDASKQAIRSREEDNITALSINKLAIDLLLHVDPNIDEHRYVKMDALLQRASLLNRNPTPRNLQDVRNIIEFCIDLGSAANLSIAENKVYLARAYLEECSINFDDNCVDAETIEKCRSAIELFADAMCSSEDAVEYHIEAHSMLAKLLHANDAANHHPVVVELLTTVIDFFNKSPTALSLTKENALAQAHMRRALSNCASGKCTPEEIIADYNSAIEIWRSHHTSQAASFQLAQCLINLSLFQWESEDYHHCLETTELAVVIAERLDLLVTENLVLAAQICVQHGACLERVGREAEALPCFEKSAALATSLPQSVVKYMRLRIQCGALAAHYVVMHGVGELEAAQRCCSYAIGSVNAARDAESQNFKLFRDLRIWSFAIALQILTLHRPLQVAKLALEHLDPKVPGSAPDSYEMLVAAESTLRAMLEGSSHDMDVERMAEVRRALVQLDQIERWFFSGSLDSCIRLSDRLARQMDGTNAALDVLREYTARRPSDPDGWLALALRQIAAWRTGDTLAVLERAIGIIIQEGLPAAPEAASRKLQRALQASVRFQFAGITKYDSDSLKLMVDRCIKVSVWLAGIQSAYSASLTDEAIECFARTELLVRDEREKWIDVYDLNKRAELLASLDQRLGSQIDLLKATLAVVLPLRWHQFAELLLDSVHALWRELGQDEPPDETALRALQAKLRDALSRLVTDAMEEARQQAAKEAGALWDHLHQLEQDGLVVGRRLLAEAEPLMKGLAAVSIGGAVEFAINHRLFLVARSAPNKLGTIGHPAGPVEAEDKLIAYLDGRLNALTLGLLISGLRDALRDGELPAAATRLRSVLTNWPGGALLTQCPPATRALRLRRLDQLPSLRNQVAHNKERSEKGLETLWHDVLGDREHGFFHYFVGAHVGIEARHQRM